VNGSWPCGQNSQPSSTATYGVTCATRREARVTGFDCGVGVVLLPALPHRLGGRVPISLNPARFLRRSGADPTEGGTEGPHDDQEPHDPADPHRAYLTRPHV
jgi:hypothetical protein